MTYDTAARSRNKSVQLQLGCAAFLCGYLLISRGRCPNSLRTPPCHREGAPSGPRSDSSCYCCTPESYEKDNRRVSCTAKCTRELASHALCSHWLLHTRFTGDKSEIFRLHMFCTHQYVILWVTVARVSGVKTRADILLCCIFFYDLHPPKCLSGPHLPLLPRGEEG